MTDDTDFPPDPAAPPIPATAGAELRANREALGLSVDDVAQQLKLAPRQVQALEDDDYARLPGRTFVRGFVRNYARYLGLDADALLARLPDATVAPALERPTLPPSGRPMGELPMQAPRRRGVGRVLIPLVLIAIVLAAGYYEYRREQADGGAAPGNPGALSTPLRPLEPLSQVVPPQPGNAAVGGGSVAGSTAADVAGASAPGASGAGDAGAATPATSGSQPSGGARGAGAGPAGTAGSASGMVTPGSGVTAGSGAPGAAAAGSAGTATPGTGTAAAGSVGAAAPAAGMAGAGAAGAGTSNATNAASAGNAAPGAAGAAAGAPNAADAPLVLTFRGNSWVQVRDRGGNVVLTHHGLAGTSQSVAGTPPLEVVIGNAAGVSVTYRGKPVDIAPFVRGDVARFQLR